MRRDPQRTPGCPRHLSAVAYPPLWRRQGEVHVDFRLDISGRSVDRRRLLRPVLHGLDRRWDQQRMPADHAEVLNTSIFPDDRVQLHFSFNPRLPRKRRILGRLSRLQFLLKQGAADSDPIHYRWQAGRRVGPIARERDHRRIPRPNVHRNLGPLGPSPPPTLGKGPLLRGPASARATRSEHR